MKILLKWVLLSLFIFFGGVLVISAIRFHGKPYFNSVGNKSYVIEEVDPTGEIISTKKGTSNKLTPFLISKELGLTPDILDKYEVFPSINLGLGSKIRVYETPILTIIDGKKKKEYRTWKKTVAEALTEAKV
jgi:uncharacterized protein YabE (DUF348 family)